MRNKKPRSVPNIFYIKYHAFLYLLYFKDHCFKNEADYLDQYLHTCPSRSE